MELAWGCWVSRGTIPLKALAPHFYPVQLHLEKPLGPCLPERKASHLYSPDRGQHSPSASPTSPATWAQLGGHTPALGKGIPAVRRAASGPFSLPTAGGCCTKEQGLCFGWLGRCTGTKITTKLCPAWPSMDGFANVGL